MPEIGAKYNVADKELKSLIGGYFPEAVAILERYFCKAGENPDFLNYMSELKDKDNIAGWDKGRVFNQNSEIRWERESIAFHVVWINDADDIPDGWGKEKIFLKTERKIWLWGKRDDKGQWYEKQIPRMFQYPATGTGERAFMVVKEYIIDSDDSTVYRFKEVKIE